MNGWFVVRTQPNRETWAMENITRQLAHPYSPRIVEQSRAGRLGITRAKFLFPTYVFVKSYDGRWRFLLGTYGVTTVMMQGNVPAIVQDDEIKKFKTLEDSDGLVHLPERRFKSGDKVIVGSGAFANFEGLYVGQGAVS